jgi:arginyl-tRNA synthetase
MSKEELKIFVIKAIESAQKEGALPSFDIPSVLVEFPEREEHGDYSTNIALLIGKKTKKNPMEICMVLIKHLKRETGGGSIEKIEAKEPGFINFWLSEKELLDSLQKILKEKDKYGSDNQNKTLVIDYSAPNIAKPFGVGHLRSTVIGQALYNIYKFLGWKCIGDSHLGDWGTQFGKLIVAIKKWNKKDLKDLTVQDLEELYVKFHKESEKNEKLFEQAKNWFKKLEDNDQEAKKIWKLCVDVSLKEFDKAYEMLDIKIDYALGESFYEDKMGAVIEDAKKKGLAKESQGALVIPVPELNTSLVLLKSDGATTYDTRDLATSKYRKEKWNPDLIIYEVGADQKFYFAKNFRVSEMLGYGRKEQFVHVAHGLIRWPHGKFSTRKGDTIHLEDILKEAIQRARKIVDKSKAVKGMPEKEREKVAKQVGIGAVKYNDLSRHHSRDIIFDWESILSLEGNSGPYLQYTVVRCESVLEKAAHVFVFSVGVGEISKEEENILRTIRKFPEITKQAAASFSPNLICNFAFQLAQKYNIFYEKHSILEAKTKEKKEFRLALTGATRQVLKNSLELLGISIPQKM